MAVLKSDKLELDFRYESYEAGWTYYQIGFLWGGEPVVNDRVLKRINSYWGKRPASMFLAVADEPDGLLKLLRRGLATGKMGYWEPVDPDITVALYPGEYFPFLRDSAARERTSTDFTLIAQVDAYNFKDTDTYHGQGLAMHMIVTRHELESFADVLESESSRFKRRHALDGSPQPNG